MQMQMQMRLLNADADEDEDADADADVCCGRFWVILRNQRHTLVGLLAISIVLGMLWQKRLFFKKYINLGKPLPPTNAGQPFFQNIPLPLFVCFVQQKIVFFHLKTARSKIDSESIFLIKSYLFTIQKKLWSSSSQKMAFQKVDFWLNFQNVIWPG